MAIFIREPDVRNCLKMPEVVGLVEKSFAQFNAGKAYNTVRTRARIRKGALHLLPAAMPDADIMGYKAYTSFREGIKFLYYLHSASTGALLAVIEAAEISRLRTGAASGVATKYLAAADAKVHTVFGTGYQAGAQLEAVCVVRKLDKINVVGRNEAKRDAFIEEMRALTGVETVAANAAEALAEADIVTTITTANEPLFDKSFKLKERVHINAAGSNSLIRREIPEYLVDSSVVVVDSLDVALKECGDILPSLEKGRLHENDIIELGEIVNGRRVDLTGRTVFESQGMGLQDLACAGYVYEKAKTDGFGVELPF